MATALKVPNWLADITTRPPALFLRQAWASERFFDFFTSNIRNKQTRRAYYNAACRISEFCAERGVHDLAHGRPVHVAGIFRYLWRYDERRRPPQWNCTSPGNWKQD